MLLRHTGGVQQVYQPDSACVMYGAIITCCKPYILDHKIDLALKYTEVKGNDILNFEN